MMMLMVVMMIDDKSHNTRSVEEVMILLLLLVYVGIDYAWLMMEGKPCARIPSLLPLLLLLPPTTTYYTTLCSTRFRLLSLTHHSSSFLVVGFRIDPPEKLNAVHRELISLHQTFAVNPIFGVDFTVEDKVSSSGGVVVDGGGGGKM